MLKKILIGVGVLLLAVVLYGAYLNLFPASPKQVVKYNEKGLSVEVSYGRPYKKGRLIFGDVKDKALQPNGKYWRLGANAATEITLGQDVLFAGTPVKKGSYRMYTIPGPTSFKVILNSELGVYIAAQEPDYSKDVYKVEVNTEVLPNEVEQLTLTFNGSDTGVNMDFAWDKTLIRVPITLP